MLWVLVANFMGLGWYSKGVYRSAIASCFVWQYKSGALYRPLNIISSDGPEV